MTGFFVRVQRENRKWESVEIDQLTDEELQRFFVTLPAEQRHIWCIRLAAWIRDNVNERPMPTSDPSGN